MDIVIYYQSTLTWTMPLAFIRALNISRDSNKIKSLDITSE